MPGSARHQWNTGGDISSHIGDGSFAIKAAEGVVNAITKPIAKAADERISQGKKEARSAESEAARLARKEESAKEHDRRVKVRTNAAVKVIGARAASHERIAKAKKSQQAYAAQQPVRLQKARNEAAALKPKKAVAAPKSATPRKRAYSPSVSTEFNSVVGDAPTTKIPVVRNNTKTEVINLSGITPAEASQD